MNPLPEHCVKEHFGELLGVHFLPSPAPVSMLTGKADAPEEALQRLAAEIESRLYFSRVASVVLNVRWDAEIGTGIINIATGNAAKAGSILIDLLKKLPTPFRPGQTIDLLPHCHIGWHDKEDGITRTLHPLTTRPFWTLLESPEKIAKILNRGIETRMQKTEFEKPE